jgi:hypothetical protein
MNGVECRSIGVGFNCLKARENHPPLTYRGDSACRQTQPQKKVIGRQYGPANKSLELTGDVSVKIIEKKIAGPAIYCVRASPDRSTRGC